MRRSATAWFLRLRNWSGGSLRWRFALVGLSVLAPLILLTVKFADTERRRALDGAGERVVLLAANAVERQENTIEQARGILTFLARQEDVLAGGEACNHQLAQAQKLYKWILALRISDPRGGGICADRQNAPASAVADRAAFQDALARKEFVVGDVVFDGISRKPAVFAALPILRGDAVVAVISVGIDLRAFGGHPADRQSDGAVMFVVDRTGAIMAHEPSQPDLIGRNAGDRPLVQQALSARRGVYELPDLSGVERIFAFHPLPSMNAVVAVGLDKASVIGPIDADLRSRSIVTGLIIGISVLIGLLGGEILVYAPLRKLARTVRAMEDSEPVTAAGSTGAGEIAALGRDLDRMAHAVADRERRLVEAEGLFRGLFEHATDGLMVFRSDGDRSYLIETINPAGAAEIGCSPEQVIGRSVDEILPADMAAAVREHLQRTSAGEPLRLEFGRLTAAGRKHWEIMHIPLPGIDGRVERIFTGVRDITHLKRAESDAREANRFLVLAEQMANVGHWRLDATDRTLRWSEGTFRIYGLDPNGNPPTLDAAFAFYHPDDRAELERSVASAIATGDGYTVASRICRPDGTVRHVISRGICEIDPVSGVKAIFGIIKDVTDISQAEEQLQLTLDTMDQGLIVIDGERRVPVCNRRAIELLNLPFEMMSKPHLDQVIAQQIRAEELDKAKRATALKIYSASGDLQNGPDTYEWFGPNGTVLEIRSVPLPDGGVVRTYTDVTARRKAERLVQDSEARYRLLADHATDMIVKLDLQGVRQYVSPASRDMVGYEPEELIGEKPEQIVHPDHVATVKEVIRTLATGQQDRAAATYRMRHKHGHWVWVEANFQLVRDDGGAPHVIISSLREVTERQKQAQELRAAMQLAEQAQLKAEQASQAKTDFLASMSHEIRTPLNGIMGYTDLLLEDGELNPGQRRFVERIQTAGSALLTVVDDVLDFSRIETGEIALESDPFSVEALAENALSIVRGIAEKKGLSVVFEADPALPPLVRGDEARLRQVLLNLLNNAVKFTHAGHVRLVLRRERTSEAGETLRFEVHDTGIGIPKDKRNRLFKRFSQVDGSIKREFGGTGLGLAISKRLVTLMGGQIGVESQEGEGSNFWFLVSLPVAECADAISRNDAPVSMEPARILLVEDNVVNQEIARAVLEAAGHQVDVVPDGADAVMAIQAKPYDLVLMDVQMPIMDGMTATRIIRALPSPVGSTPIVAMTANVLPLQIKAFKEAGMNDHVGKPFSREELYAIVGQWAGRQAGHKAGDSEEAPAHPPFDQDGFEDLVALMGRDQISKLLDQLSDRLRASLTRSLATPDDRRGLAREAHAIVSSAGMLGFMSLSRHCAELERACEGDDPLDAALQQVRSAADDAVCRIDDFRRAA